MISHKNMQREYKKFTKKEDMDQLDINITGI